MDVALGRHVAQGLGDLLRAVAQADQRLLLELKSRLDLPSGEILVSIPGEVGGVRSEVREALVSLGYGPQEIAEALRDMPAEGDIQRLLKDALTKLSRVG